MELKMFNGLVPIYLLRQGIVLKWHDPETDTAAYGHLSGFAEEDEINEEEEKLGYKMELYVDFGTYGIHKRNPEELEYLWNN